MGQVANAALHLDQQCFTEEGKRRVREREGKEGGRTEERERERERGSSHHIILPKCSTAALSPQCLRHPP